MSTLTNLVNLIVKCCEREENIELERLRMEYDIAKTSTTSGENARMIFLGFLITINLAFFKGYYDLLKNAEWTWGILLCVFALMLNISIALIYIREQISQEDNHKLVWRIREKYNELMGKGKKQHPNWFIIKEKENGFFIGLIYKVISSILSAFVSLIILSLLVIALKMNAVKIVGSSICTFLVLLFVCLFLPIFLVIYFAGKDGGVNGE